MSNDIWAYAEHNADGLTDLSLQCLAKGRQLAAELGGKMAALLVGSQVEELAEAAAAHGADRVLTAADPRLEHFGPDAYQKVVAAAAKAAPPRGLLFPASTQGTDLAPGVAQALGAGCVLDCQDVSLADGRLVGKRLEYDRNVLTAYSGQVDTLIVTVRDGIAEPAAPVSGAAAERATVEVVLDEADLVTQVLKREVAARTVNLKEASIIVSAGAGVGSKENFALVEELARTLGGEVGATRAAVDAGWTTLDRQIGQTGETVRPDLYVACGISGAVQHRVGMMDSKRIVALNIDPNAPIFRFSHYCVVGDLLEVIPKLIRMWQS
jgi:electron transfer flavoprotein alpha subunit